MNQMRSVLSFLSILLLLSSVTHGQNRVTDTSATCIAFWKNGETKIYQLRHSKEKIESGISKSFTESVYEAHLKVVDSTEAGFTMEWVYKNFSSPLAGQLALNSLNAIMEGLKIKYKTDDVGMFTELLNWQEVRDFSISNYEKAIAGKSGDQEYVAALNQVKAIFSSKENIENLLIKEVQMFHAPYGVEYSYAGTVVDTELPNATGGAPFPATITLKLNEVNSPSDLCRVSVTQSIDKGKAGPIIAEVLRKLSSTPIQSEEELTRQTKSLEISDTNEYTYHLSSGWIKRIYYKRLAITGKLSQVELYEITQKK